VRDDHGGALIDGWFASNTQLNSTSLPNRANDIKPVDERTLKLGKSVSHYIHPPAHHLHMT